MLDQCLVACTHCILRWVQKDAAMHALGGVGSKYLCWHWPQFCGSIMSAIYLTPIQPDQATFLPIASEKASGTGPLAQYQVYCKQNLDMSWNIVDLDAGCVRLQVHYKETSPESCQAFCRDDSNCWYIYHSVSRNECKLCSSENCALKVTDAGWKSWEKVPSECTAAIGQGLHTGTGI